MDAIRRQHFTLGRSQALCSASLSSVLDENHPCLRNSEALVTPGISRRIAVPLPADHPNMVSRPALAAASQLLNCTLHINPCCLIRGGPLKAGMGSNTRGAPPCQQASVQGLSSTGTWTQPCCGSSHLCCSFSLLDWKPVSTHLPLTRTSSSPAEEETLIEILEQLAQTFK